MPVFGSSIAGTLTQKDWSARVFPEIEELTEEKVFLPAIGVFVCVWFGLDLFAQVDELGLVWQGKFFKNDSDLPGIGSLQRKIPK